MCRFIGDDFYLKRADKNYRDNRRRDFTKFLMRCVKKFCQILPKASTVDCDTGTQDRVNISQWC